MRRVGTGVLIGLGVLALVATVLVLVDRGSVPSILDTSGCTAEVDGHTVEIDLEQAENAALITAVSIQRGMPARAASIALATAFQESKLYNIDYGDRDSVGLFQQRPSQGWGSVKQLTDPVYATHAFYDALERIDGYSSMPVTEAAQEVQRSGFPDAYADHEPDARVLASALTGNSRAAFWCTVDGDKDEESPDLDDAGLTQRAEAVRSDLARTFGTLPLGGFAPGWRRSARNDAYRGRSAVTVMPPLRSHPMRSGMPGRTWPFKSCAAIGPSTRRSNARRKGRAPSERSGSWPRTRSRTASSTVKLVPRSDSKRRLESVAILATTLRSSASFRGA